MDHQTISKGRPTREQQKTPRTNAWLALVKPIFAEPKAKAEFARFVEGENLTDGQKRRWANDIARWMAGERVPSLEHYFLVSDWLLARASKPKPSNKKTRTA